MICHFHLRLQIKTSKGDDRLRPNEQLQRGKILTSKNGQFKIGIESRRDSLSLAFGKFVLWSVQGSERVRMNEDGNLIAYGKDNNPIWESKTKGQENYAIVLDNGCFAIYDSSGQELWSTGTILSLFKFFFFLIRISNFLWLK